VAGGITPNQPCPAGYYCPEGTGISPTPCPAGKFNPSTGGATSAVCETCPAGTSSAAGATECTTTLASPGYYLPSGSSTFIPCPIGTYLDVSGGTNVPQTGNIMDDYSGSGGSYYNEDYIQDGNTLSYPVTIINNQNGNTSYFSCNEGQLTPALAAWAPPNDNYLAYSNTNKKVYQ
jgi:hypothetical protein